MTPARTPAPTPTGQPDRIPAVAILPLGRLLDLALEPAADEGGYAIALPLPLTPDDDGARLSSTGRQVSRALGIDLAAHLRRAEATGRSGEVVSVPVLQDQGTDGPVVEVLLVGVGDGSPGAYRRAGAASARRASKLVTTMRSAVVAGARDESVRAFVEGYALASYSYSRKSQGSSNGAARSATALDLYVRRPGERAEAVRRGLVTARAVHLSRDLANEPSDVKSPAWLASVASRVGTDADLGVRIRDERELRAEGFNGILSVGQGSVRPPRLIELSYRPRGRRGRVPHVVLVGKGITFDTGGISIKPNDGMLTMKMDMAAGAAVIGAMTALRDLDVPVRVTALVAAAENMPSGTAQRPADVITHYGGTTVEVLNTDAEGRLVLADALAYADSRVSPDAVVDLATLTGAATMALGKKDASFYSNDDRLAAGLERASAASGDRIWRMPLVEDYRPAMDSMVADLANIATDKTIGGGSITAALFLREFVGDRAWAHFDMSGPAKSDKDEDDVTRGATGFGVRLLLALARGRSAGRPRLVSESSEVEIALPRGDVTEGVVRVDDTVRRPHQPQSDAVAAYLHHLEAVGFDGSPRFLGRDDRGRDVLTYLDGDVPGDPADPWAAADTVLASVGHLVRRLHTASAGFAPAAGAVWRRDLVAVPAGLDVDEVPELVSHLDVTPQNVVFRDGVAVGLIDFDLAGPATRLRDVYNTAMHWVPLREPADVWPTWRGVDQAHRLRVFADAYGLTDDERVRLPDLGIRLADVTWHRMKASAEQLGGGWARMWDEGVGDLIRRREAWLIRSRSDLLTALVEVRPGTLG